MALYKEKISERESEDKTNIFDYFGRAGAGAPMRSEDGRIITKRRTLLNNQYEAIVINRNNEQIKHKTNEQQEKVPQLKEQQPFQEKDINNKQGEHQTNLFQISNVSKSAFINPYYYHHLFIPQHQPYIENEIHPSLSRSMSYQVLPINHNISLIPYTFPIQIPPPDSYYYNANMPLNMNRRQQIQLPDYSTYLNPGENNFDDDNNYYQKRTNRVSQLHLNDNSVEIKKRMMREEWLNQIEDKQERLKFVKAKKLEEEKAEEAKWTLYLEKQKQKEKKDSIRKVVSTFPPQQQKDFPKNTFPMSIKTSSSQAEQTFKLLNQKNENKEDNGYHWMINIGKTHDNTLQNQIAKLRHDVNNQYIHMTNMYGKLKNDVLEADQQKSQALQESLHIKDELIRNQLQNLVYENKIDDLIDRKKYYIKKTRISTHQPIKHELIPKKGNLKSTSDLIYDNEIIPEHSHRNLGNLARAGQNLVGEAEFVPIETPRPYTEEKDNKDNVINEEEEVGRQFGRSGGLSEITKEKKDKIIKQVEEQSEFKELFSKLNEIAEINHQMNPLNKFNTMRKNLEIDYGEICTTKRNNEEIKKLDNMLEQFSYDNIIQH